jgi:hypothetical protein
LVTKCGRRYSRSVKLFTPETLAQHERDCPACNPEVAARLRRRGRDHDPLYELATDIGGEDLPDGAFWALCHELGGTL